MSAFTRLLSYLRPFPGGDLPFENYYSSLARKQPDFAPQAAEARRDFERVRNVYDRAFII